LVLAIGRSACLRGAPRVRIILANDRPMFRQGLRTLLGLAHFEVVGEAGDGIETARLARDLQPDIVILSSAMRLLNTMDTARAIRHVSPHTEMILLTTRTVQDYVREGVRAGIKAYIGKAQEASDLLRAIHKVLRGQVYPGGVSGPSMDDPDRAERPADPLTPRERQVVQLIAEGRTTKEVAQVLDLSVKTVDTHRSRIMRKLGIHETAGLVRYAIRQGLSAL
jgi:two-component system response regulator NreC